MTTYQLQANFMADRYGLANAIVRVKAIIAECKRNHSSATFCQSVLNILNEKKGDK